LGIGEENSGKLVTTVRRNAQRIADEEGKDYVIIDGPPGIGCPVIASITDTDLAIIVTEPTLSGMHDMKRVAQVTKHFKIPAKVVINKFDLNSENSEEIRKTCRKQEMDVIAQIPFTKKVSEAIVQGVPFVEFNNDSVSKEIFRLWESIR
jgi:MinD superfamily P-loop ATPase